MSGGNNPTSYGLPLPPGGSSNLYQALIAVAQAINNLNQTTGLVFPAASGTASSATAGSATLPAHPVGFITVTLPNGTMAKVPYYAD